METLSREDFTSRFTTELMRVSGADKKPNSKYAREVMGAAKQVAGTYYDDEFMRNDGPEECARSEYSYW